MPSRTSKGRAAEELAARFLAGRGFQVLERNYRTRRGELDIIARQGDTLCIIEVRSREGESAYVPEAGLSAEKIKHLRRTAQSFLQKHRLSRLGVRLDLLVIDWGTGKAEFRFYPGAAGMAEQR